MREKPCYSFAKTRLFLSLMCLIAFTFLLLPCYAGMVITADNVVRISYGTNSGSLSGSEVLPVFANNLILDSVNPIMAIGVNTQAPYDSYYFELEPRVDALNCHFDSTPGVAPYQNIELVNCSIGDPLIEFSDLTNYSLIWTDTEKSPLINAGCPEIDGVPQFDPDGTPPDIGAIYYPHYQREYFAGVSPSNIYWLSFPVVDDRSHTDGIYWNELGHMFEPHMLDAPNSQLELIDWSYDGDEEQMYNDTDWLNTDHPVTQPKGYKIKFAAGIHPDPVVVNGFKADPATTPVKWVVATEQSGQMQPFANRIGYFVPYTYRAGDALSRPLPGSSRFTYLDYVHTIKTQTWSTYRANEEMGSPWVIDPNSYTFSEGDMVELLLLPDAPVEMYWNTELPSTPPIQRPQSTAFDYEEKLDYATVFLSFDPEDMPDEVGLFVDGECRGAAVVDSSLIDVCLYPGSAKAGSELEIVFHYEGKGKKAAKGWKSYNPDTMLFEERAINPAQIGRFAYLCFSDKDGQSLVPLTTSLSSNYPNPFNPSTNISFILAQDMDARLEVYNLRGQKVKTLCNASFGRGKHSIEWNGRDDHDRRVASGIYFYRLSTPEASFTQKMMLMK